ncbi:hypothetical protein K435DRAFT_452638 [Dendrothele bispora CBS 962.96]|uniref:Uncharacterized protein n=1 Tax=Dendrothele bispora (strain CBS 962.96) TaxID=1314807 RepID=A0A4V4HIJ1_DENBC|nr:hypothetical protein K435DRAFT_452638 [Dendrothele bispora CBS 962.96]
MKSSLQSSSSALTSMRSSLPHGLSCVIPSSAATSSANCCAKAAAATLAGTLFAPSCIALVLVDGNVDRVGTVGEDTVEFAADIEVSNGLGLMLLLLLLLSVGGVEVGRSVEEVMVLCRSAGAS